jgi:hypothetical protein
MKKLEHGLLLRSKFVIDNAIPNLENIRNLIAPPLHNRFDELTADFCDSLCECDVSDDYIEKSEFIKLLKMLNFNLHCFAPHTTNSDVDDILLKYDYLMYR